MHWRGGRERKKKRGKGGGLFLKKKLKNKLLCDAVEMLLCHEYVYVRGVDDSTKEVIHSSVLEVKLFANTSSTSCFVTNFDVIRKTQSYITPGITE